MSPETTTERRPLPLALLVCMRPKQWSKNMLLFSGIFLNARFGEPGLWLAALQGFVIFCLLSGAVYIINDIKDVEADRIHPRKRRRPIAAGDISPTLATLWCALLTAVGLGWAWMFGQAFWITAAIYWVLVLAYSMGLKHVVILDVMALAAGFVLRAMAGIFVLEVPWNALEANLAAEGLPTWGVLPLTNWFLSCTMFLALFIALAKRRAELVAAGDNAASMRRVLEHYSLPLLDQLIGMSASLIIVMYALYCLQEEKEALLITMPFVLFGVMRFLWHVYRNDEGGAPETLLYKDRMLLACVVLWVMTISGIMLT